MSAQSTGVIHWVSWSNISVLLKLCQWISFSFSRTSATYCILSAILDQIPGSLRSYSGIVPSSVS